MTSTTDPQRSLGWIGILGALLLLLSACGSSESGGDGPSLAKTAWNLTELDGSEVFGVAPLTIVYGESTDEGISAEAFGSTGCNSFNGPYSTEGNSISMGAFITTLAGCIDPPLQAQEGKYLITLETAASFSVSGETLELSNEAGETTARFEEADPDLTLTNWEAITINNGAGGMQSVVQGSLVTIKIQEIGLLAGSGGCNTYSAAFRLGDEYDVVEGGSIQVAGIASTRKSCDEAVDEQEANYYAALESARIWVIRGLNLELRDESGSLQVQYVRSAG